MARTYASVPVLSKIKIGNSYYYLKDGDVRALLDSINSDAWNALLLGMGPVSGNDGKLVSAESVKTYVDAAVAAIPEFDVVVVSVLPQPSEDTWHKIYLLSASDPDTGNVYKEYITLRAEDPEHEGQYIYSWEMIGDTALDLSGYLTDVRYLDATHKLQQQKGNGSYTDVHEFGAMADANLASGYLNDYVTGVSSAKVTAEGSISGGLVKDSAAGVQITGTVSKPSVTVNPSTTEIQIIDSLGELPSKDADSFHANTPTVIDTTKFNAGQFVEGEFTAPSLKDGFYTAGSAAQFTEGAFTPATLTTQTKALYKQGIKAEVGTGTDAETLIFSNVGKEADIKVVDTFSGGSKAADTFVADIPTVIDVTKFDAGSKEDDSFTPPSFVAGFYTAGSAATFTEGTFHPGARPTKKKQDILGSVTAELAAAPVFTGDKYAFSGSFSGSEVDATVTLTKDTKQVSVLPEPKAPEE